MKEILTFIWHTYKGLPLIEEKELELQDFILKKAGDLNILVTELDFSKNSVRIRLEKPKKTEVREIIKQLKGYSSYMLRRDYSYLRQYPSFWEDGYY